MNKFNINQPKSIIGYYDLEGYPATLAANNAEIAAEKLDKIESQIINDDIKNFVYNEAERKNHLRDSIKKNTLELNQIRNALRRMNKKDKIHDDLKKWLKIKKNEGNLLQEEIKLFDDIMMMLTKLEAAKYLAEEASLQNNIKNLPYYEQLDLKKSPGGFNPFSMRNLIATDDNHIKEIQDSHDNDYIDLDSKIAIEKAEDAISYVQKVLSVDSSNIVKLISKVRSLVNKEISEKEDLLKNKEKLNKLESLISKRNFINNPNTNIHEQYILNLRKELDESKHRLWEIKEIEWIVTQIEAAKYLAQLRETSLTDKEFTASFNKMVNS